MIDKEKLNNTSLQKGKYHYSEIVNVDPSLKKSTLYSNALSWFAYNFNSAKDVIQIHDQNTGKIIGKGILTTDCEYADPKYRNILIAIDMKDGMFRYDITLEALSYQWEISMKASCFNCGTTKAIVKYHDGTIDIINISGAKGLY